VTLENQSKRTIAERILDTAQAALAARKTLDVPGQTRRTWNRKPQPKYEWNHRWTRINTEQPAATKANSPQRRGERGGSFPGSARFQRALVSDAPHAGCVRSQEDPEESGCEGFST